MQGWECRGGNADIHGISWDDQRMLNVMRPGAENVVALTDESPVAWIEHVK